MASSTSSFSFRSSELAPALAEMLKLGQLSSDLPVAVLPQRRRSQYPWGGPSSTIVRSIQRFQQGEEPS